MSNVIKIASDLINEEMIFEGGIEPKSNVEFIFSSGKSFSVDTNFSPEEFIRIYRNVHKPLVLYAGNHSYAYIDKKAVVCYHVTKL